MFRNTFQKGFLSVFKAGGSKPLAIWDCEVNNGSIRTLTDQESRSLALDIRGLNVATCFISAPKKPCQSLGIKMPFLIIVVKNIDMPVSIEVQVKDDHEQLRRFRLSNYQSKMRLSNFSTNLPLVLNSGWNQVVLNLAEFTNRAYQTNYMETVKIIVNANCQLKNVYFSDRLYSEEEKPKDLKWILNSTQNSPVKSAVATRMRIPISTPTQTAPQQPQEPSAEQQLEQPNQIDQEIIHNSDDTKRPNSQATQPTADDDWFNQN